MLTNAGFEALKMRRVYLPLREQAHSHSVCVRQEVRGRSDQIDALWLTLFELWGTEVLWLTLFDLWGLRSYGFRLFNLWELRSYGLRCSTCGSELAHECWLSSAEDEADVPASS